VPIGEKGDEEPIEEFVLPDNLSVKLPLNSVKKLAKGSFVLHIHDVASRC
jgi:hypothetical protein